MIETIEMPELVIIGILVEAPWQALSSEVPKAWQALFAAETGATGFLEASLSVEDGVHREIVGYLAATKSEVPAGMTKVIVPAQRYLSDVIPPAADGSDDFFAPVTPNLVVMLTAAYRGEEPALETSLASLGALSEGLRALINLHYQEQLEAIQVHWSPASPIDALTDEQLLLNFAELIPL